MTAYTDFHYSPTGSGVISGAQVLEQTEQGINGLGQYVQDNVSGAIDTANQALTIAQTADSNATLALNTANSFASAISTAQNTADNALTTAQSAQSTANNASSLATTANNNANTALNAANTATANVGTLTNSVNALGNRMTTAENAISTNAGNITTLQTNLQTTNNNVTTAMNNASIAVATAQSAQQTATATKNAAYVLRYTGTTITGGGTIAYADIDNTDNIKAGDKIIDVTGDIYRIASVDIANETVTVDASDVIHLAADSDVVHKSGNETIGGVKTFSSLIKQSDAFSGTYTDVYQLVDSNNYRIVSFRAVKGTINNTLGIYVHDQNNSAPKGLIIGNDLSNNISIAGSGTNNYLGTSSNHWTAIYSDSYYYGTTAWGLDKANVWTTAQTISTTSNSLLVFKYGTNSNYNDIRFNDENDSMFCVLRAKAGYTTISQKHLSASNWYDGSSVVLDSNGSIRVIAYDGTEQWTTNFTPTGIYPTSNNALNLGTTTNKWKTLNGINPGALSLPNLSSGTGVSLSAGANSYSPPSSGWLSINLTGAISVVCGNFCHSGTDMLSVPVVKGSTYTVTVATSGTAYLFVSQGNV